LLADNVVAASAFLASSARLHQLPTFCVADVVREPQRTITKLSSSLAGAVELEGLVAAAADADDGDGDKKMMKP